jgi:hypothetical protein
MGQPGKDDGKCHSVPFFLGEFANRATTANNVKEDIRVKQSRKWRPEERAQI